MSKTSMAELGISVKELSNLLIEVLDVIWKEERYIKPVDRFLYTILMKLNGVLESIHIHIYNLHDKPHYSIVVALALRACMLDVMNVYFVCDVFEDEKLVADRINMIMSDHLKYIYRDLSEDEKRLVQRDWPELFDHDNRLTKFPKLTTTYLVDNTNRIEFVAKEMNEVNFIYSIFSKYEHNGAFSFDLIHSPYSESGVGKVNNMIRRAIQSCALALKIMSSHWLENEAGLSVSLNQQVQKILQSQK